MFHNASLALLLVAATLTAACKPTAPVEATAPVAVEATADIPAPAPPPQIETAPKPDVVLPPEACTREGGWDFFQQFVASADVRRAYSRLDLKAGIAADVAAAHPEFDGFRVGLVDSRWALVDPAVDASEYPRVDLKSSTEGDVFKIEYTRAHFSNDDETVETYGETAGYTFEFIDGCWMLVGKTPTR
ncbi:MAG: hypothetical protein WAZ48_02550 [Lysobacteraceae bacterium]